MNGSYYYFYPCLRAGLAATLGQEASSARAEISAQLELQATTNGKAIINSHTVTKTIQLWGPGDIIGFDESIIARTDPKPNIGDFEPNFFPFVEFSAPDFAWRFTAKPAEETNGSLIPWITLIVLRAESFSDKPKEFELLRDKSTQLPYLKTYTKHLPDLKHAARWAHVQLTGPEGLEEKLVEDFIRKNPERAVCRLMCPRRLRPRTKYQAFIVPTFLLGSEAVLEESSAGSISALQEAWDTSSSNEEDEGNGIMIPYYYTWEFRTGVRGDFEHLVRLLKKLKPDGLGLRDMHCDQPGYGIPGVSREGEISTAAHILGLEGALQPDDSDFHYTDWGGDAEQNNVEGFQSELAELLNQGETNLKWNSQESSGGNSEEASGTPQIPPLPKVLPPMYGRWHAAEQVVDPDWQQKQECKTWFHRLNTDPRHRVAAGMGAEVIRKHQESLMASAWEQVGEIEKANDLLRRAQIGRETSNFLYERLGGLLIPQPSDSNNTKYMDSGLDTFLSLTRPVQKRLSTTQNSTDGSSTGTTIAQKLSNSKLSQLPAAALDPAFRRISRVRGPIRKRQPNPKPGLLRRLAEGDLSPAGPHPRPDGTLNVCDVTKAAVTFLSIKDVLVTAGCSSVYFEVNLTRTSPLEVTVEYETEDRSAKASEGHYSSKRGVLRFLPKETKKVIKIEISNDVSHFEVMKTFRVILSNPTLAVILDRTGEANIVPPPVSDGDGGTTVPGGGILVPEGDIGGSLADAVSNLGRLISFSSTVTPRETSRKEPLNYYRFCERNITCRTLNEVWSQADLSGNNHELTNQAETKNLVCQALDDWLNNIPAPEKLPQPREDFLDEIANEVIDALDPKKTILARTQQRLRWSKDVKHIGDPLDPIMAAPEFPQPMYEQLRDISQEWILPGVAKVPQNTIGLLKSNRRFIEAYMIGLNHEFARELLWRGYPTDQRGSYFRQFWDVSGYVPIDDEREDDGSITLKTQAAIREKLKDISYIHEWRQKDLGANDNRAAFDKGENLVLIVRGDLLKKYPNTLIYAIEGAANPKNALRTYFPIFSGTLPPDLTFLGFSFTQATALGDSDSPNSGIYFVIEERISETRFGLNEPSIENSLGSSYLTWAEITWAHFADDTNKPINYDQYLNGLEPISNPDTLDDNIPNWNGSSAAIAHITCQSPVRMILHAREMLFKKIDALLSPEFKSFWPPLGQPGINVLLFGRNFTVGKPTVKFGTYTAEIVNSTDTQILTRVPLEFDSDSSEAQEVTITVTNYYGTIEYPQPFKIPPSGRLPSAVKPVVSPEDPTSILQGTPGTTIYFQGSQFLEEVWFGTFSAQIRPKQGGGGSSGVYTLGYFVTIPEMLPGRVPISLQNEHGIVTLSETFSILTKSNYWYGFSAGIGGDLI